MPVSPIDTAQPVTPPPAAPAPAQVGFEGEEFSQFLRLLTAQVENQDPLKPLDSTAFVEQLATFSSLEQQVKTNDNLKEILSTLRGY